MKTTIALLVALTLSGCVSTATIADQVSGVADNARESAELVLCRGITVGSWVRAYGDDPSKAAAWRTLCTTPINQTPSP